MKALAAGFLFAALLAGQETATVEGRVVNSITGVGVRRATVTLVDLNPGAGQRTPATAVTDADGRFLVRAVGLGKHTLRAAREGFADPVAAAIVRVEAGQPVGGVIVKLVPLGAISGRVLDAEGEPIANVYVQAARHRYEGGTKRLSQVRSSTTNDRGEFRIYYVPAGRYYILASRSPTSPRDDGLARTFYPGARKPSDAVLIELAAGEERRDVEFRIAAGREYQIAVRVNSNDQRLHVDTKPLDLYLSGRSIQRRADGAWVIRGLPPGKYRVFARLDIEGNVSAASQTVEIVSSDVEVWLTLRPTISMRGSISLPAGVEWPARRVLLIPDPDDDAYFGRPEGSVSDDHRFTFRLLPIRYRLVVADLPKGAYVKNVRWKDELLPGDNLDLSSSGDGALDVVVAADGGEMVGTVATTPGEFAIHYVALLPRSLGDAHRAQQTQSQSDGSFHFRTVEPGDYRLFALAGIEPGAVRAPEFAAEHEKHGILVTVRPSTTEKLDQPLKPIAAP